MPDFSQRTAVRFETVHRAKFSDLDPNGHVNTEKYLTYFLDHRFTGMRETLKWGLKELSRLPIFFVCRKAEIDFKKPLFADEEFRITSAVTTVGTASCGVRCELTRTDGSVATTCSFDFVCVDRKTQLPIPWPEEVIARFFEPSG